MSLSPASVLDAQGLERLVLPSPNGSTIASGLAEAGAQVVGGCFRNATAVARWLAPDAARGANVAVIAAGERWPDGSLRPAAEDLWGAGAVLAALRDLGVSALSPEARLAEHAYLSVADDLEMMLRDCASGRELIDAGYGDELPVAAEVDVNNVVPLLVGDAFVAGEGLSME